MEEVRKVGLSLDLKDEQKLAGGNGIRSEGLWVEKKKGGFLGKYKEVKGDWKDDESEAQGREVRNEFRGESKGQVSLGFSGCVRI